MLRLNLSRVLAARNGLEALEVMGAVVPNLILLDLRMPEIDGPTSFTMPEGAPVLRRMPVLIVSGSVEPPLTWSLPPRPPFQGTSRIRRCCSFLV